jgi:hypothetical protein
MDCEAIVRRWHKAALPFITTKSFDETMIDFVKAWPNVKYPAGSGPLVEIMARAKQRQPTEQSAQFDEPKMQLLVLFCEELQRHAGDEPFFLSCRKAGELLKVDHMTANRWLFYLVAKDVLTVVEKGRLPKRATSYLFNTSTE